MKTKLLFLVLLATSIGYAQATINNFFSTNATQYKLDATNQSIDQSADGANAVWNFDTLIESTTAADFIGAPSAGDVVTYPGSTLKIKKSVTNVGDYEQFIKEASNDIFITGFYSAKFELKYSTNNAELGSYPANFGDSANNDTMEGTYNYDNNGSSLMGTFSGTIVSSVDAHGTLTTNDVGNGGFTIDVTRFKSVQTASLYWGSFPVGTATLTTYKYFDDTNGNLIFRSNRTQIVVDAESINEDDTVYESMVGATAGINDEDLISQGIKIYPNPVSDILNVFTLNNQAIKSITIIDITGKVVLKSLDKESFIAVDQLQSGIYLAKISTENNFSTLKFIKK